MNNRETVKSRIVGYVVGVLLMLPVMGVINGEFNAVNVAILTAVIVAIYLVVGSIWLMFKDVNKVAKFLAGDERHRKPKKTA